MNRPLIIRTSPRKPEPESQRAMLADFWRKRKEEIETMEDFNAHMFPMTRLKKVLCAEKGKMMMTSDTPSYVTKACELFVQEITFRAWMCATSHHRSIILDTDIAEAIAATDSYDFLQDVVRDFRKQHGPDPCSNKLDDKKKCRSRSTNKQQASSTTSDNRPPPPPRNLVPRFLHPVQIAHQNPLRPPALGGGVRIIHLPLAPNITNAVYPMPYSFATPTPPLVSTTTTVTSSSMPIVAAAPTMISPVVNYMPTTGSGFVFGNDGTNTTIIVPSNNFAASNNSSIVAPAGVVVHPLLQAVDAGGTTTTTIDDRQQEQQCIVAAGQQHEEQQHQQHQVDGTIVLSGHSLHALEDGTSGAAVASTGGGASTSNAGGDTCWDEFINFDEFDLEVPDHDQSFMSGFWKGVMMEVNDDDPTASSSNAAAAAAITTAASASTTTNLLPAPRIIISDMQDLERFLFDDDGDVSPTTRQAQQSSAAAGAGGGGSEKDAQLP